MREGISKAVLREGLRLISSESKINAIPNYNGTPISEFELIPLPPLPTIMSYFALCVMLDILEEWAWKISSEAQGN